MNEAEFIFLIAKLWIGMGFLVAAVFLFFGMDRIDDDADGAYIFRVLLLPGVLLIWPLVLWRWFVLETGRDQWFKRHDPIRNAHLWVSVIFCSLIFLIIAVGVSKRQIWPVDFVPQKLALLSGATA